MERIKLNLIPSGVAPIVHLSQYDDGRKFGIDLFEGESVYVLDGTETLTVNSRKPDGHVVTLSVTNTGTSSLDVDTIEQLTAVHGVSYAKLQIEKGSVTIATLPFLIDVSRDPLENGDPSESFVHNLRTQIADGVAEEVAEQYDSANVIFDAVPTSGHGNGYTVTSEGIKTALDAKVNTTDFDATNLPITSGSATNTKTYFDNNITLDRNRLAKLEDTTILISAGATMPTGFPLPLVTRRGNVCTINFAVQLPAGTYAPTDTLWNVSPIPLVNSRCVVACNGYQLLNVLADGTIKFNSSITLASASYIIGQVVYLTDG